MKARVFFAAAPLTGTIDPPSSKNYTTRYILASCLAAGTSVVRKPAVQDDAVALVRCCRQFGARIEALDAAGREVEFAVENAAAIDRLRIEGFGDSPREPGEPVDPANAGTVLRLLLGVAALVDGEVRFRTARYADSLGKRPNRDLVDALLHLGADVEASGTHATLPIVVRGGKQRLRAHLAAKRQRLGLAPHDPVEIPVSGATSSQFVSSLLFLAPLIGENIVVRVVDDLKSRPLVDTTCAVLADAGIAVTRTESGDGLPALGIAAEARYAPRTWGVNGDWPGSAAILAAAAAVPGSAIRVRRLHDDEQGERRSWDFYRAMGCRGEIRDEDGEAVRGLESPSRLRPAQIDGDLCTDAVLAMMGAAALAQGESVFTGITNLQFKECDRVREPIAELRRIFATGALGEAMPAAAWEPDGDPTTIRITGSPEGYRGGIDVDGRGDHRVIMMLSIVGLRCRDGLTIRGAEHVAKSFPAWFDTLRAMGARVELA